MVLDFQTLHLLISLVDFLQNGFEFSDRSGDLESLMVKSTYPDPSISDLHRLVIFLYRSVPQLLYCAPFGCSDSKTAMPLTRFFDGELSCWIPRYVSLSLSLMAPSLQPSFTK